MHPRLVIISFYKDAKYYVGRNEIKDKKQPPLLANGGLQHGIAIN